MQITAVFMCFFTFSRVFNVFQFFLLLYLQLLTILVNLLKILRFTHALAWFVSERQKTCKNSIFFAHTVRFFLINMKNWYSLIFFIYIRKCQILWKKSAVFACFSSFENKTLLNACKTQYFQQNFNFKYNSKTTEKY